MRAILQSMTWQRSPARGRPDRPRAARLRTFVGAATPGVLIALLLVPLPSAAAPGTDAAQMARPGAFCSLGRCRPVAASPWSGAAFAAAIVATVWTARRRENARR